MNTQQFLSLFLMIFLYFFLSVWVKLRISIVSLVIKKFQVFIYKKKINILVVKIQSNIFYGKNVLPDWSGIPIKKKARKLWLAAPLSLIWAIWKERNIIVFEVEVFSPTWPKLYFVRALISWVGVPIKKKNILSRGSS